MYQEPDRHNNQTTPPEQWSSLIGGEKACTQLRRVLAQQLPECFGYYGLALGPLARTLSLDASPVRYWYSLGSSLPSEPDATNQQRGTIKGGLDSEKRFDPPKDFDVLADYDALPIASDSVDVILLPHLLEFIKEPHSLLREIERVIIPDGHLILSGINPVSWYGCRYLGAKMSRKKRQERRLVGLARLKDWLLLLGFQIDIYGGLQPGVEPEEQKIWQPMTSHFNSHYFIIAKKCVSTMTPIRPSWHSNQKLVPARFAEPGVQRLVERELKKAQH